MEETLRYRLPDSPGDPAAAFRVDSAVATHTGLVRHLNEDAVIDRRDIGLWAVADGVGGADSGDFASRLIVETLARVPAPANRDGFVDDVRRALHLVNAQLRAAASTDEGTGIIASTVVCLLFCEGWFCCLWAGDSRAYRLRGGMIEQLTHDHSEVQSLVDYGLISEAEARRHPRANVITRAVGGDDKLQLDLVDGRVEPDDAFLVCTDGLTKVLLDTEIAAALARPPAPAEVVDGLIRATLDRGAPDNVSIALVHALRVPAADG